MKTRLITLYIILSGLLFIAPIQSQNTNTIYFMEDVTERNSLNPAFMPQSKYYFDFIILPNFYLNAGNNDFILRDLLFNNGGITQSFLKNNKSKDKFFNSLKNSTRVGVDFSMNIMSLGFAFHKNHYLLFDAGFNLNTTVGVPKDIFKLALYGTPERDKANHYNLSRLGVNGMLYSNVNVGYMYRINPRLTVGVKTKFLIGYAGVQTDINKLELTTSQENWTLVSQGRVNASVPMNYSTDNGSLDLGSLALKDSRDIVSLLYKPAGYGVAFDLGATYKPIKNLTVSASFTDLGFIRWSKKDNIISGEMEGTHNFDGIDFTILDDQTIPEKVGDELVNLGNEVLSTMTIADPRAFNQMMYANFIIGAEYALLNNKISFGALSRTRFNETYVSEEVTVSANFRPANFFKGTLSYSLIDGRWGTIGAGLNLCLGRLTTYIAADFIPLSWSRLQSNNMGLDIPVPYRMQGVNLQAGFSWNICRYALDKDDDGVRNYRDKCPETDIDFLRKSCNTKRKRDLVDRQGCAFDDDKDGISNCIDRCANTPEGVEVDTVGCPVDSDKDAIADYLDLCPDTPEGVEVDKDGCPLDGDGDKVPDYLDKCSNTPANVVVDADGCPVDTDGDNVPDYLDKCSDTPANVAVDANGCPLDTDGDNIPDYLDKCPNTGTNVAVDENGCPLDSDGDGVLDTEDKCPDKQGPASNQGCPELTKEVVNVFKKALNGIQFESGRNVIKKSSYAILDQIVAIMALNNDYNLAIKGHTDNVGREDANKELSQKRAEAVKTYLVKNGIAEERITAEGLGESLPVADNKTSKGRMLNRRVEFEVSFTETTIEKVTNPELEGEKETAENAEETPEEMPTEAAPKVETETENK